MNRATKDGYITSAEGLVITCKLVLIAEDISNLALLTSNKDLVSRRVVVSELSKAIRALKGIRNDLKGVTSAVDSR